jgi:hypothetical protein
VYRTATKNQCCGTGILFDQDSRKVWILIHNTGKSFYENINIFILFLAEEEHPRKDSQISQKLHPPNAEVSPPLVVLVECFGLPLSFYHQAKLVRTVTSF